MKKGITKGDLFELLDKFKEVGKAYSLLIDAQRGTKTAEIGIDGTGLPRRGLKGEWIDSANKAGVNEEGIIVRRLKRKRGETAKAFEASERGPDKNPTKKG